MRFDVIKAGDTATIGFMNFAKKNGERLNPQLIKVREVSILAETPYGTAVYSGKWE